MTIPLTASALAELKQEVATYRANYDPGDGRPIPGKLGLFAPVTTWEAILSAAERCLAIDAELAQRRANFAACQEVGISARWCPVCGTCTCPLDDGDLDTPDCPLHGTRSGHCAPPIEDHKS